jgi:hypothetical protein
MTDPVDTDALRGVSERLADVPINGTMEQRMTVVRAQVDLRTAADEVDRLRAERDSWQRRTGDLYDEWEQQVDVTTRLRAAIENAPHEHSHGTPCYAGILGFAKCTCWKADAL